MACSGRGMYVGGFRTPLSTNRFRVGNNSSARTGLNLLIALHKFGFVLRDQETMVGKGNYCDRSGLAQRLVSPRDGPTLLPPCQRPADEPFCRYWAFSQRIGL